MTLLHSAAFRRAEAAPDIDVRDPGIEVRGPGPPAIDERAECHPDASRSPSTDFTLLDDIPPGLGPPFWLSPKDGWRRVRLDGWLAWLKETLAYSPSLVPLWV